jgi:hypothetical protein
MVYLLNIKQYINRYFHNNSIMKIFINASEVASMIGRNKFKAPTEVIFRIWGRYFAEDLQQTIHSLKKQSITVAERETNEETVNRIAKESGVNIKDDINTCNNVKDVAVLKEKKKEVIAKLEKSNLTKEKKKEFMSSFESVANTNFGTKNESSVLEEYIVKTKTPAITSDHYYKRKIHESNIDGECIEWIIIGKVDGLVYSRENPENNTVVEIKSRIYRYFKEVRDYEKIQAFTYMFLLQYRKSHLVEALKERKCDINIIELNYEEEYWKEIVGEIKRFIDFFSNEFMTSIANRQNIIIDEEGFGGLMASR